MMTRTVFRCLAALLLAAACSPRHTQDLRERTVALSCALPAFLLHEVGYVAKGAIRGRLCNILFGTSRKGA